MATAAPIAETAAEAFRRYELAFNEDRLVQSDWHSTADDGRTLACALGVLGDDIDSPKDCPAAVMPRWLAQMVPAFFDRQSFDDAKDWGLRFYKALDRLDGKVSFSVVYDWHATTVTQMGIDAAEKRGRDIAPHKALQDLHRRALAGDIAPADEWRPVLKTAYADADADADADAYAYASADADAYAYASADAYADAYASADAWKRLADGMVDALNRVEVA